MRLYYDDPETRALHTLESFLNVQFSNSSGATRPDYKCNVMQWSEMSTWCSYTSGQKFDSLRSILCSPWLLLYLKHWYCEINTVIKRNTFHNIKAEISAVITLAGSFCFCTWLGRLSKPLDRKYLLIKKPLIGVNLAAIAIKACVDLSMQYNTKVKWDIFRIINQEVNIADHYSYYIKMSKDRD